MVPSHNAETSFLSNASLELNPSRLHDKIFEAEAAHADQPFLTTALPNGSSETTDFKTAIRSAQTLARYLREDLGYEEGDVVGIQSPNCTSYIVSLLGVYLAGLTITNINPLYTAAETRRQLKDSGARCLIGSTIFSEMIEEAVAGTKVDQVIAISVTDFFKPLQRSFLNLLLRHVKKLDRPFKGTHKTLNEILANPSEDRVDYVGTLNPNATRSINIPAARPAFRKASA